MLGKGLRLVLELRLVERGTERKASVPHLRRGARRCPSTPHRDWSSIPPRQRGAKGDVAAPHPPARRDKPDQAGDGEGA